MIATVYACTSTDRHQEEVPEMDEILRDVVVFLLLAAVCLWFVAPR